MTTAPWLRLHPHDDVLIATRSLVPGERVEDVVVRDAVPSGHKVAARAMEAGAPIRRYNQLIGLASAPIAAGAHVHLHNLAFGDFTRDYAIGVDARETKPADVPASFMAYRRRDGRAGTRNYIGIIASVNCSATVVRAIADHFRGDRLPRGVDGVVPLAHPLGCGMNRSGEGMRVLRRTLLGYASHPNFAGVLLVGLGCEAMPVPSLLEALGGREEPWRQGLDIQDAGGTSAAIRLGIERVEAMLPAAARRRREPVPVSELIVGLNCGGSDGFSGITANPALGGCVDLLAAHGATAILSETPEIYGAEHLLTRRAASAEVARKLLDRIRWWEEYTARNGGEMDNNPSPGNREGGLTTILEKSLGAVAKGGTTNLNAVYEYAERVTAKGLVFMDTPGYDPVSATGQAAGGAQIVCFTTGRGSAFGCAAVPTLKLASNNDLWRRQRDDMDLNCGDVLDGAPLAEVSRRIFDAILRHASGEKVRSECLGYGRDEFVPWQIGAVM